MHTYKFTEISFPHKQNQCWFPLVPTNTDLPHTPPLSLYICVHMYPQVTQKALLRSGLEASTMADIITYICKQTMVSTKPVQPRKYYHLSVLDRQMERNHLRIVFYYPSSSSSSSLAGMSELRKRIRESISEVLSHFPMITGRLQKNEKGQWMIKCNDAGVRAVEARAKGSVEDWLKCVDREKELMLVCWEEMFHKPYFWSTFYVQVNYICVNFIAWVNSIQYCCFVLYGNYFPSENLSKK